MGRIVVITGARQVGKTTLVRQALSQYRYLPIEDPVARDAYGRLSASQWHLLFPQAALDEVQKSPMLIDSIKAAYDMYDDVRYVLLGSSQLLLLKKVKESLAGRCVVVDMYLLTYGGYPALVDDAMDDAQRRLWLKNYVRTYLERDVRDLANFNDLEPYTRLQRIVAAQTAQTISLATLSRDVGVSTKTVQRYLEYLNISYQSLLLPAWDNNPKKRIAKVHFMGQGVLQAVLQKQGGMTGTEFESVVVTEIYKQTQNLMIDARFHHLRTSDGREIDLLVELPQGYSAFEIKMAHHVQNSDARHLKSLGVVLDKPLLHGFVLSNSMETKQIDNAITAVNAAMFLG